MVEVRSYWSPCAQHAKEQDVNGATGDVVVCSSLRASWILTAVCACWHTLVQANFPPSFSLSLSLSLSTFLFFPPSFFQSLCRISSNPPITVMSGWEQGRRRQREAVRDWEDRWERREGGMEERDSSPLFYLLWVSLIPWPCADWSVKINSRDQMSGPGALPVVIQTLWELMCGQAGMWI